MHVSNERLSEAFTKYMQLRIWTARRVNYYSSVASTVYRLFGNCGNLCIYNSTAVGRQLERSPGSTGRGPTCSTGSTFHDDCNLYGVQHMQFLAQFNSTRWHTSLDRYENGEKYNR
ncbi:hypothetical protein EVAR_36918_1 [Eumeta japonica]|uniref:Uncharacterized protein n=1 Tax=Eumeta variegata TaxID=151549 RepID=A0A4C1X3Y0_EUMVA|nr:hypothetical protein EVAR_36918_1 [Eumeta japonica]